MGNCAQIALAIFIFQVKFQKVNFNTSVSNSNSQTSKLWIQMLILGTPNAGC